MGSLSLVVVGSPHHQTHTQYRIRAPAPPLANGNCTHTHTHTQRTQPPVSSHFERQLRSARARAPLHWAGAAAHWHLSRPPHLMPPLARSSVAHTNTVAQAATPDRRSRRFGWVARVGRLGGERATGLVRGRSGRPEPNMEAQWQSLAVPFSPTLGRATSRPAYTRPAARCRVLLVRLRDYFIVGRRRRRRRQCGGLGPSARSRLTRLARSSEPESFARQAYLFR